MKHPNRFIVVDDDPINNLICKHAILRFNRQAEIELFTEAEHALVWIEKEFEQPCENRDIILFLDINMPSMNGWEFLDEFKRYPDKVHKHITIYILSSSIDSDDLQKAEANRFVKGFYSKPLLIETLKQIFEDMDGFSTV